MVRTISISSEQRSQINFGLRFAMVSLTAKNKPYNSASAIWFRRIVAGALT
jgi:hypothetical protein